MLQAQAFTAPQFKAQDLHGLSPAALAEVAAQMLEHIGRQSQQIAERDRAIKFKDAKIERITFELARLKAWKFSARTEAMNAEQRQLFEETLAADEASLQAQLEALQAQAVTPTAPAAEPRRQPKRQALPEHLVRVEHHHEPENTTCPTAECGQPMVRVGEDVSERLDIIPAQFFVHRHIRGKWACRCCQVLVQEPVEPQIIDSGMPAGPRRGPCVALGFGGAHAGQPLRRFPCRTTGKRPSTPARTCTRRGLLWRRGRGVAVLRCNRCSTCTASSCSVRRCCKPMRHR